MSIERNARGLAEAEVEEKYPGLPAAFRKASLVTSKYFRLMRPHIGELQPPLLLCETDKLNTLIGPDSLTSGDPAKKLFYYQVRQGTIYGADRKISEELKSGPNGMDYATLLLAEQHILAFSTYRTDFYTRFGYMNFSQGKIKHNYQPGRIYEHDLNKTDSQVEESATINPDELVLTQNAAQLATHFLLDELVQKREDRNSYPFVEIVLEGQSDHPFIIQKGPNRFIKLLESLQTGKGELLEPLCGGMLLPLLNRSDIGFVSLARPDPRSMNDVKFISSYSKDWH